MVLRGISHFEINGIFRLFELIGASSNPEEKIYNVHRSVLETILCICVCKIYVHSRYLKYISIHSAYTHMHIHKCRLIILCRLGFTEKFS